MGRYQHSVITAGTRYVMGGGHGVLHRKKEDGRRDGETRGMGIRRTWLVTTKEPNRTTSFARGMAALAMRNATSTTGGTDLSLCDA